MQFNFEAAFLNMSDPLQKVQTYFKPEVALSKRPSTGVRAREGNTAMIITRGTLCLSLRQMQSAFAKHGFLSNINYGQHCKFPLRMYFEAAVFPPKHFWNMLKSWKNTCNTHINMEAVYIRKCTCSFIDGPVSSSAPRVQHRLFNIGCDPWSIFAVFNDCQS